MRAGLERHDERGPARALTGRAERVDLGVGSAELRMESFPYDLAALQHDRADEGVRRDAPPPSPGEVQRAAHRVALGRVLRS